MASNVLATPSAGAQALTGGSLWPLPPLTMGTLFNTPSRVARLQARWSSSSAAIYQGIYSNWSGQGASNGIAQALQYLATNNATNAVNAYNVAMGESYNVEFQGNPERCYTSTAPFAYCWCKPALNSTQQGNLIAQIESWTATRQTALNSAGGWGIGGPGNDNHAGQGCFVYGVIACNGQPSTTDRRTVLRNFMQNYCACVTELYAGGAWRGYAYVTKGMIPMVIAYHVATGEESLLATRFPWLGQHLEYSLRHFYTDYWGYFRGQAYNSVLDGHGQISYENPDPAYALTMIVDITKSQTGAWLVQQINTNFSGKNAGTASRWSTTYTLNDATWLAFLFNDDTITPLSPAQAGLPLAKMYDATGEVEFRGGWNLPTDMHVSWYCGATALREHEDLKANCLMIRVGNAYLIKDGYSYGGRPTNWEAGSPGSATTVGDYTMCRSGLSFTLSADQATREDRYGSVVNQPAASTTTYPVYYFACDFAGVAWDVGRITAFTLPQAGGVVNAQATGDWRGAFEYQGVTGTTQICFEPGATSDVGTVVLWDQFTAPGTVDHIRRNFWSFFKPTISGETVMQGASAAGVLTATGDHVVVTNGSYQATIQMVSTMDADPAINVIGGTNYESFFDGYGATGGSNLDWLSNSVYTHLTTGWMAGIWRSSFRTRQSLTSEMITVITVGAAGSTAPTYTRTSALALFTAGQDLIAMPGNSQYWNTRVLNATTGKNPLGSSPTLYAAACTVMGTDAGTGFTEPSGNGYARKQTAVSDWNSAVIGSPATATNANDLVWPAATGTGWPNIVGIAHWDSATGGNLICSDFLGPGYWAPFTCTAASPGVITCEGHGFSNGQTVAVTTKFGGALPTLSSGSWGGLLTVANVTTNTFTVTTSGGTALNTSSVGSGSVKQVVPVTVAGGSTFRIPAGQQTLAQQ